MSELSVMEQEINEAMGSFEPQDNAVEAQDGDDSSGGEELGEYVASDGGEELQEDVSDVADVVDNEPKRSKMIPRDRFDEVNERAQQAERAKQELEFKFNQQTEALNKLMAKLSGEDVTSNDDADDEILDTALDKKVDSRFSQIEERDFARTKQQELSYLGESAPESIEKAVAAIAIEIMQDEASYGRRIDESRAEQAARNIMDKQMRAMYKENAQSGAIARAIQKKAEYYDFIVNAPAAKTNGQKPKNGVNMKALDKARTTAGAPTIDKEAVTMTPNNIVDKEIRKARESGLDDDYLAKFGF